MKEAQVTRYLLAGLIGDAVRKEMERSDGYSREASARAGLKAVGVILREFKTPMHASAIATVISEGIDDCEDDLCAAAKLLAASTFTLRKNRRAV